MRYLILAIALVSACVPQANEPTRHEVSPDSAQICTAHCNSIGLQMSAVVIILSSVGCVCEVPRAVPSPGAPGMSAAAGGAVVMANMVAEQQAAEAARQQQQRQQQQQQQRGY